MRGRKRSAHASAVSGGGRRCHAAGGLHGRRDQSEAHGWHALGQEAVLIHLLREAERQEAEAASTEATAEPDPASEGRQREQPGRQARRGAFRILPKLEPLTGTLASFPTSEDRTHLRQRRTTGG